MLGRGVTGKTGVGIAQTMQTLSVSLMSLYLVVRRVWDHLLEKYPWLKCEGWLVVGCDHIIFTRQFSYFRIYKLYSVSIPTSQMKELKF